jgi:uncharacterized lipoprotein YajG
LLSACATAPTHIRLYPDVRVQATGLGQGRVVAVSVVDANTSRSLGAEQHSFPLEQPASVAINDALVDALNRHGFSPQTGVTSDYQLKADVIKADNVVTKGTFTDKISIDIQIQVTVTTPSGNRTRTFSNAISRELAGSAKIGDVAGELNQLMAVTLGKAVNDGELLGFLAQ